MATHSRDFRWLIVFRSEAKRAVIAENFSWCVPLRSTHHTLILSKHLRFAVIHKSRIRMAKTPHFVINQKLRK